MHRFYKNLEGRTFGRWTVLKRANDRNQRRIRFICKCSCGIEKSVASEFLLNGQSSSCGCFKKERSRLLLLKHGLSNSKEYNCWRNMKQRCLNVNNTSWHRYGGRGIKICKRWVNSFENFIKDMGSPPSVKHQIDRINNNGNYIPNNCRWVTLTENTRNREGQKLDMEKVSRIRARFSNKETKKSLAKEYGVSTSHIQRIIQGIKWRN